MSTRRADIALLGVAASWGMTFPLIRGALAELEPAHFILARFLAASLLFLPLLLASRSARAGLRAVLPGGLLLAAVAFASYLSQTIGLTSLSAGRAAFITGTNVVIVPLIAPLFGAGRPRSLESLAAVLALGGLWVMTDPSGAGLGAGDLWVLGCAVSYALYIHVLQRVLRRSPNALALAFVQVAGIALLSPLALPLASSRAPNWSASSLGAVAFCALIATVGTFWLQSRFQRETTPNRAALIFATEPIFAAAFAWLLLGERLGARELLGAGLILLAIVGVELAPARATSDPDT